MNRFLLALVTSFLLAPRAFALDVVCTLPWLGDLTHRLAPDATITVLARGTEDPHSLAPTPALMARVGRADLYIQNGMGLELWSERLLDGAGNPKIRPGQAGNVVATAGIPRLEVPATLSRARGDLHPEGNPHVWLDPLNAAQAGDTIAASLGRVDSANADAYRARARSFREEIWVRLFGKDLVDFVGGSTLEALARNGRLRDFLVQKGFDKRLGGWLGAVPPGRKVVFYHQSWVYLVDRFGLEQVGIVEARPGIAPSAAHRNALATKMKAELVDRIGITSYYDDRIAKTLAADTGARLVKLPGDVGGTPAATDYFTLIDTIVGTFLE